MDREHQICLLQMRRIHHLMDEGLRGYGRIITIFFGWR
jgi:hypothetical protein